MILRTYAPFLSLIVACCGMSPALLAAGTHEIRLDYAYGENLAKALEDVGIRPSGSVGNATVWQAAAVACTPAGACSVTTVDGKILPTSAVYLAKALQVSDAYLPEAAGEAQLGGQNIRCERDNDPYAEATCTLTVRN